MKKDIKAIALFYLGVALFTYTFNFGINSLSNNAERDDQNKTLVIKLK